MATYSGATGGGVVSWADIAASGSTGTVTGTNADQTMPSSGTLSIGAAFDDLGFNYTPFKNGVSQGLNAASITVSAGDLVHFSASYSGLSGTGATGTVTTSGVVATSFGVSLSRT